MGTKCEMEAAVEMEMEMTVEIIVPKERDENTEIN